ncbi:MAG: geranylgeranyl reductase family protein [Bacteroidetes bacterium]|nr:geranylgeranyl reductase family protein [Bacteroidota bacterium]MBP6403795.1 geranylgeranyl reductase family protein [Bacteroidia bacterium]MBP6650342.1 geranylgeranyl reductase family protein [Bacteroidia bacterium]
MFGLNNFTDVINEKTHKEFDRFAFEINNNTINSPSIYFDLIIIGSGPAGSSCALSLKNSGLKIALMDKSDFPRDKVCGDAIGGRVKRVLDQIDPALLSEWEAFPRKNISKGWKLVAPNGKEVSVYFSNSGYVATRMDFDHFLFQKASKSGGIETILNDRVSSIRNQGDKIELQTESGKTLCAKMVIGCDGAHSIVAKQLAGFKVNLKDYSGAVRTYYEHISGITDPNLIEIYLLKDYLPGYFWIFPLSPTSANVGFGMLSEDIRKRKLDLKIALKHIIHSNPMLKSRFENAVMKGEIEGFGLPLGGKKRALSGNRFLLCGDAASLIDPLNGEGIGNAMLSGRIAAEHVIRAFQTSDFSANNLHAYDRAVYKKLYPELRKKWWMQKIFNRPWLINRLVNLGISNPGIKDWIGKKL